MIVSSLDNINASFGRSALPSRWFRLLSRRQRQVKGAATALFRFDPNPAAVPFDDALHDRQAHPLAFADAGMRALENLKDFLTMRCRDSQAIVFDVINAKAIRSIGRQRHGVADMNGPRPSR